jgi:hypothetical protein
LRVPDAALAERLTRTPSRLPSPEPVATVRSSIEPLWNEWYEARLVVAMTKPIMVGRQLSPGGTPDYRTRRTAAIHTEPTGAYAMFGYDHFRRQQIIALRDRVQ